SLYTLAFTGINEGWNRIAHESILAGTDVIGVDSGGLGDLLKESGSMIANSAEEFANQIFENKRSKINEDFIEKYDETNAGKFLESIVKFIES
ncbi:MAG: glycosyltransferase, partial [Bacteroidia bacterium]